MKIGDKSLDSLSQNPIQVSSCNGIAGDMMEKTLTLGIALLRGGNIDVQLNLLRALIFKTTKLQVWAMQYQSLSMDMKTEFHESFMMKRSRLSL